MTDEELITQCRAGDESATDELIARFGHVVRYLARPYFLAGGDAEDLVQEGMIGLLKAIRTFDESRDASFKTYASTCIKSKLLTALKNAHRKKHSPLNQYISLEAPFFDSYPDQSVLPQLRLGSSGNPEEHVIGNEALEELSHTLNGLLSGFEAKTLALYLEGRSYQEISKITSKPQKSVDNAVQRIRRKLVTHLSKQGKNG